MLANKNIDSYQEPFNNGCEHGLVLKVFDEHNSINIWACQQSDSNQIMVVVGSDSEKDINNWFSEDALKRAKYFNEDSCLSAVQYAYNLIRINFREKMQEIDYEFKLNRNLSDLRKIDDDENHEADYTALAVYTDNPEKIRVELDFKDNGWWLSYYKNEYDYYEPVTGHEIEPDLESSTYLMLQMMNDLEAFLEIEVNLFSDYNDYEIKI